MVRKIVKKHRDKTAAIAAAMELAEARSGREGKRLTELRRLVLEIVAASPVPMGAYDILGVLTDTRGRTDPPTVYRALDFLLELGLLHRVESLNAFVSCIETQEHVSQFLICRSCGTTTELSKKSVVATLRDAATDAGFAPDRFTIEISGTCLACAT